MKSIKSVGSSLEPFHKLKVKLMIMGFHPSSINHHQCFSTHFLRNKINICFVKSVFRDIKNSFVFVLVSFTTALQFQTDTLSCRNLLFVGWYL